LIGNMIFLWAFGRRLEDACGPWRFLLFYLLAGMVATMGAAFLVSVNSDVPGIGASGAISGVMGGYLLLFPVARMECLWLVISIPRSIINRFLRLMGGEAKYKSTIKLPAIVVVLLFVASDIIETFTTAQTGELIGGVNYVAHATGFLAAITIFLFVRKDLAVRYFAGRSI
ncbi:MAG: rhomboid family intramembrane serine protease, partial [Chitinophagaceae bacterium]|nr:rhomboid family intramembrane serine protease [Anaerolineae bacterium]